MARKFTTWCMERQRVAAKALHYVWVDLRQWPCSCVVCVGVGAEASKAARQQSSCLQLLTALTFALLCAAVCRVPLALPGDEGLCIRAVQLSCGGFHTLVLVSRQGCLEVRAAGEGWV